MEDKSDKNMTPKENDDTTNNHTTPENEEPEDEVEAENALEEIATVNDNLDSLSSLLDVMEQKTDDIRAQLLALLSSNREIRESIKENVDTSEQDTEMQ